MKRRHRSGRNSRKTSKPVWNGRQLSGQRTLQSNAQKMHRKENKNRLDALIYLERHLKNPASDYGDKTIRRRRQLPSSQIKFWNRWKDIWITSRQRPRKRLQMEARLRNCLLVWRSQSILSSDSSKNTSACRNKLVLLKIREHPPPAGLLC